MGKNNQGERDGGRHAARETDGRRRVSQQNAVPLLLVSVSSVLLIISFSLSLLERLEALAEHDSVRTAKQPGGKQKFMRRTVYDLMGRERGYRLQLFTRAEGLQRPGQRFFFRDSVPATV